MGAKTVSKLSAELLGTFFFVYLLGATAIAAAEAAAGDGGATIVLVIGSAVALAFVYWLFVAASGAHLNPFVSLALAIKGRIGWRDVIGYIVAQAVGAFGAALVLWGYFGEAVVARQIGGTVRIDDDDVAISLVQGAIAAFLLVSAYLLLTEGGRGLAARGVAGFGVGLAFGLAVISGAEWINIAQVFATDLVAEISGDTGADAAPWGSVWIHILAPLAGAVAAPFVWGRLISTETID